MRTLLAALALLLTLAGFGIAGESPDKKRLHPQPPKASATLPEIRAWVARTYPRVVFNPEGIPADVWASFFADFCELAPDLPGTIAHLQYIGTRGTDWEKRPNAVLATTGNPGGPYYLSVNPGYHRSLAQVRSRTRRDEENGWHVRGSSRRSPTYPGVSHELAHLLELEVRSSDPKRHARWMDILGRNDAGLVSVYAGTDDREAFAEAVTAWHMQDPEEFAPLTRELGAELKALGISR